jgi:hypothetical protein
MDRALTFSCDPRFGREGTLQASATKNELYAISAAWLV